MSSRKADLSHVLSASTGNYSLIVGELYPERAPCERKKVRPTHKLRKLMENAKQTSEKYEYVPGYGLLGNGESITPAEYPLTEMDWLDFSDACAENDAGFEWNDRRKQVFRNAVSEAGYELTLGEAQKLNELIDKHFNGGIKNEEQVKEFEHLWELECYK